MFIVQLGKDTWRSRCCFGITSYPERAAQFPTERGAKISLANLRRFRGREAYPDATVLPASEHNQAHDLDDNNLHPVAYHREGR